MLEHRPARFEQVAAELGSEGDNTGDGYSRTQDAVFPTLEMDDAWKGWQPFF